MNTVHQDYKGSITLYLSISLALILSLLCYTIHSCHLDAVICRAEGVSYISVDSLLSMYCRPLLEKYGLFALNEQGLDLELTLKIYAEKNCETPGTLLSSTGSLLDINPKSSSIDSCTYLTDDDGQIFADQVCEYVKYMEIDNSINALLDLSKTDIPKIFPQTESGSADINFGNLDKTYIVEFIGADHERTAETSEDLSDIDSKSFLSSITTNITHYIKNALLVCLVSDPTSVSTATIEKIVLPSVTCQLSNDGVNASYGYYEDVSATTYEKAAFCEYVYHTFGNYTSPNSETPLQYQMEYVISGQDSDDANLINTACQLITLRTGLNLIHLISDSDKFNAAWAIASSASHIPGVPIVIQATILTIWATAEAVLDVRDLLKGKKVPLVKNSNQWNLSIKNLLNFSAGTSSKNDGTSGLTYSRYLQMLLATQNQISLRYRTLDLIQMDICEQYHEDFRISKCVTGIEGKLVYTLPSILSSKKYTYSSLFNFAYN